MAITPQQIAQLRAQAGLNSTPPPVSPSSPNSPSNDDIINQRKQALGLNQQTQQPKTIVDSAWDLGKSLVSAPATMVARPFQALQSVGQTLGSNQKELTNLSSQGTQLQQELQKHIMADKALGKDTSHAEMVLKNIQNTPDVASQEQQNQANYQPSSGGIVAEAPKNMADVKKDVGRGIQTVALGLGPVAGGAAFGAGTSLEQGNDLFSLPTAFNTVLGAAGGKILDVLGKPIFNAAGNVIGKVTPQFLQDLASKGSTAIADFAEAHGIMPQGASDLLNNSASNAESLLNKPFNAIRESVSNKVSSITGKNAANQAEKETAKLTEMISPKMTSKETKLAQSQGRIVAGKEPTMFKSGTDDTVIPTDKIAKATQTIQREIPNASKLAPSELHTALDARTTDMAEKLKPEMQNTPVKPETIDKINSDWQSLKKEQQGNIYTPSDVNVKRMQSDFEQKFVKSPSDNMDQLWDKAKAYDNSVPDNIKKANSLSSESLQAKKEIWLQNRGILRDAITDAKNGMGETAGNAFSDMHDMYNAKENLLSKAKIEKAQSSKIVQWAKDHPYIAGTIAGTVAGSTGIPQAGVRAITGI
jgi:hypothetical protein